jgi:hypothetical protein
MDYLDRLLASPDIFLASAGLSRPSLQATFASLNSLDIH